MSAGRIDSRYDAGSSTVGRHAPELRAIAVDDLVLIAPGGVIHNVRTRYRDRRTAADSDLSELSLFQKQERTAVRREEGVGGALGSANEPCIERVHCSQVNARASGP